MTGAQNAPRGTATHVPANDSPSRMKTAVLILLIAIPSALNAIALFPEVRLPVPSLNDDAVHYLFVQRASEALANGENLFDHWVPELDMGFPQFFYYQHLPHVAVVLLHRLFLKQVDLLTVFNLVRYLLLVGFPVTVYWSMRQLGFSTVAAAVGAGASSLISFKLGYGLEYDSYIWGGHGMYTQLWAVHLSFITLAFLDRLLERGAGYAAAVASSSLLALCHLIYAYIVAVAALLLVVVGMNRANAGARLFRTGVVGLLAAVTSSYLWFPWLRLKAYMGVSPYLERWKYDSFGAKDILTWLVNGDLLDHGRLPALTLLLALGIASAVFERTRPARLALAIFFVMLALFFGRHTWGTAADLLPLGKVMHFLRFSAGAHLGAILLIGLGGEWLWRRAAVLPERWRAVAAGLVLLTLIVPALRERQRQYRQSTSWMNRAQQRLDADDDARAILSALKELPPARTYAGLRSNWGKLLKLGDVNFYDLLTFHRIVAISPPYQGHSLNADLIWHFDDKNPAHYSLFNVRYVVAPSELTMAAFLRPIKATRRYTLYRAETSGYAQFAAATEMKSIGSQSRLFFHNRDWLLSPQPAGGQFIRYDYPSEVNRPATPVTSECAIKGRIVGERVGPGRIELQTECQHPSTLVLKMTYHPNWRVTIDGRETRPFMLSPSFIGVEVPGGLHAIRAEYRSPTYKVTLLLLGACTMFAAILFRRRFARLDLLVSLRRRPPSLR